MMCSKIFRRYSKAAFMGYFHVIADMPPPLKKRNKQKQGVLEGSFSDPGDKLWSLLIFFFFVVIYKHFVDKLMYYWNLWAQIHVIFAPWTFD